MFQEKTFEKRIKKLQQALEPNTLYIISKPSHITYFTDFRFLVPNEREAFFVCGKKTATLIYSSFSPTSNFNFLDYKPGTFPTQLKQHIEKITSETNSKKIIFDDTTLFVSELSAINSIPELIVVPSTENFVAPLVAIKDSEEIACIKKACEISYSVFLTVKEKVQKGMTELAIKELIALEFKKHQITETAFPTIVAFGANCAKPHHQPDDTVLEENMPILIDMGAKFEQYCADMTRTFWFGPNASSEFLNIEKIVLEAYELAQQTAEKHTSQKILAKNIDNAARTHISNQGFGDNFIHTTGHGLGIDIHETPSISWQNGTQIENNMVITIEPGIYLEGNLGYRHENTILITKDGIEVLTKSPVL